MTLSRRSRDRFPTPRWWPFGLSAWPTSWSEMMERADLRIEEFRDDGYLVIRVEIPGIDPDEDVEITVSEGMLHIRAERREETTTEGKEGYRSEFSYGSFGRSVRLPAGVSEDDIEASYRDGILEVRAPIDTEKAASRKITVNRG